MSLLNVFEKGQQLDSLEKNRNYARYLLEAYEFILS